MKIIIITAVFPPEPVVSATISYDLANALSFGNDVTVLCPKPTRPLGYYFDNNLIASDGFKKVQLNSYTYPESQIWGRLYESVSFGINCANYILKNRKNIDIIYFNTWPLFSQLIISVLAKTYNIKYVAHIQDVYPETILKPKKIITSPIFKILLSLDKYVLKNAKSVIVISERMSDYLKRTRNICNNVSVIYNWSNDNYSKRNSKTEDEKREFRFMFLGSLSPTAGIENIIYSFDEAKIQNAKLIIAGMGSDKSRLMEIAQNCGNKCIEFVEAPKTQVGSLQNSADVLLLSLKKGSAAYSLPSKLTSYLFSTKPVLAFVDQESAVSDIISNAQCGWICESENKLEMSKMFQVVYDESNSCKLRKGENGFLFAKSRLTKELNLKLLMEKILGND